MFGTIKEFSSIPKYFDAVAINESLFPIILPSKVYTIGLDLFKNP